MTKEEALEVLKNSEQIKPVNSNGTIWKRKIGEYLGERNGAHAWAVYYYSTKSPVNPNYAFAYFVETETKEVSISSAPI